MTDFVLSIGAFPPIHTREQRLTGNAQKWTERADGHGDELGV